MSKKAIWAHHWRYLTSPQTLSNVKVFLQTNMYGTDFFETCDADVKHNFILFFFNSIYNVVVFLCTKLICIILLSFLTANLKDKTYSKSKYYSSFVLICSTNLRHSLNVYFYCPFSLLFWKL